MTTQVMELLVMHCFDVATHYAQAHRFHFENKRCANVTTNCIVTRHVRGCCFATDCDQKHVQKEMNCVATRHVHVSDFEISRADLEHTTNCAELVHHSDRVKCAQ